MSIQQLPPQDKAVERQVCASVLANPKLLADVWPILADGEVFYHGSYQVLATLIYQIWNEGKTVRLLNVMKLAKEKGKFNELPTDLANIESEGFDGECVNNAFYLRDMWIRRQAITGAREIEHKSKNLAIPADEIVTLSGNVADTLSKGLSIGKERTFKSVVHSALKGIEEAMNAKGGIVGVPCFTPKLSRFLGGWNKCVHAIGGRPGMGKTVVAVLAVMEAAREGYQAAYVSLEVKAEDLAIRMFSELTLIHYGKIKRGQISQEQFAQIHSIAGQIEDLPIHIYDDYERDISAIRNWLIDMKRRNNIQLVVIDYVQLLEDKTCNRGETEEMAGISRQLLKLQRRLDVAMLEFLQLNREVEKRTSRRPSTSDLKSTGQFEQDAEVVILLYRDDYYKQERNNETGDKEPFDNELEMIVAKNRNGETGSLYFYIDVANNRIMDEAQIGVPTPGHMNSILNQVKTTTF